MHLCALQCILFFVVIDHACLLRPPPSRYGPVGKAIGTIAPLLDQYDEDTNIKDVSGSHKRAKMGKDVEEALNELTKYQVFAFTEKRKYISFHSSG